MCICRDVILLRKDRYSVDMVEMTMCQHDADRLEIVFFNESCNLFKLRGVTASGVDYRTEFLVIPG